MKIYAQMDPKSHPKIDLWAIRGSTFEVFGSVLRIAIFLMIFEVCQNRPKMIKVRGTWGPRQISGEFRGGSAAEAVVLGRVLEELWEQVLRTGSDTPGTTV